MGILTPDEMAGLDQTSNEGNHLSNLDREILDAIISEIKEHLYHKYRYGPIGDNEVVATARIMVANALKGE